MEKIKFKSTPENFRKEFRGIKQNTLRKCDDETDYRFIILNKYIEGITNIILIEIVNSENKDEFFTRIVSDVTKFEDFYIISWNR